MANIGTLMAHLGVDTSDLKRAERDLGSFSQAGSRNLTSIASSLVGITAGFVTLYTATTKVWESAKDAARFETLGVVMNTVGANAGYTALEMANFERALMKGGIAMIETRSALSMMSQAQLDLTKSSQLARVAQDAAVIGNINSSEAFERMVQGIRSGEVEILRTIGINVLFEEGYERTAAALGKNSKELSAQEKIQSRMNQVLEYGTKIQGTYEASMKTAGKQLLSFSRYTSDLSVLLGHFTLETMSRSIFSAADKVKGLNSRLLELKDNGTLDKWSRDIANSFELAASGAITLAKIIGVGGALYIAVAHAPLIWGAFSSAILLAKLQYELFAITVRTGGIWALLTSQIGGAQLAITSFGTAMKAAAGVAFAAWAGWEIGKWLYENFEVARVAGLALVDSLTKGWIYVEYGAKIVWENIRYGFETAINKISGVYVTFLENMAAGFEKLGLEGMAENYRVFAASIGTAATVTAEHNNRVNELDASLKKDLATHESIVDELYDEAVNYKKVTVEVKKDTDETKRNTDETKKNNKVNEEAQKAAEKHARALQSVLDKYLPMESAVVDMNEEQALLNELFDNGVLVGDRYTEAMGNFTVATKEAAFAQAGLTAAIMDTGYEIGVELPEQWDDGMDLIAKNAQEYSTKIPSEWEKGNEEIIKLQEDLVNDLGRIMEGFVSDILTGEINSIEDLFKGLFDSVLDMFARMIAQMAANSIIDAIFGSGASGGPGLGSLFGLIGEFFGSSSNGSGSGTGTATSLLGMLGTAYEWLTGTSISGTIGSYLGIGSQTVIAPYVAGSGQSLGTAYIGSNMAAPAVAPTTTTAASSTTAASIAPYAAGAAWVAAAAWAAYSHFEHKQQPTTADFYNQMGLRPEDFASLIGDEFKLANIPLFGDVLSKWDQTSNSLIMLADAEEYRTRREYTGAGSDVMGWGMGQMSWDDSAPTWSGSFSFSSFYETLQGFSDFTHTGVPQSLDEYAEALRKLGYSFDDSTIQGIWEWGQATMTSTERIQMSFEDLGLSGAQLRRATELLNNAYLTAEGTTKELEEYLLGLGYTTEEVSEVLSEFEGNFIKQMKRMGEEAMPPLMKAMADQVNSYTKLSATMNLASVQANSLNANYDSLAGGIDEFGNTLNDFSNSIGDVNMAVDEAANSLVTIADNTLESIYGILEDAEGLVGTGTVPQPAPGPTPTEPTSPAPTPVTGPTAGNIQVNVMIDGKQLDARTEIIADRLIVARENRPNVKGRRVLL